MLQWKTLVLEKILNINTKPLHNVLPIQEILHASLYAYKQEIYLEF